MDDVDSIEEPTSSLVWVDFILADFKGLYLVICKTLALIFPIQLKECSELHLCKNPTWNMHVYLAKSSRFESTDFESVMIDTADVIHVPRVHLQGFHQSPVDSLHNGPVIVSGSNRESITEKPTDKIFDIIYIWYIRMISWHGNIFCIALALYAGNPLSPDSI